MSTLKVNELDTESGTTITVAAGKTLAGTDIIGSTQIAANAVDTNEIAANAVTLAEMAGLARGKLIVGDASGDPSALTVGTTGQYLTSDGSDVSWGAVVSLPSQTSKDGYTLITDGTNASWASRPNRNIIINGNFNVWQRNTSFAAIANATYAPDRFFYEKTGAMVHTITRDADVPTQAQSGSKSLYSMKVDCTTVDASIAAGDFCNLVQRIEGYNFSPLEGNTATLSFWVKATKTGTYCVSVISGGSDRSYVSEYTVSSTDTWEKKTATIEFNYSGGTWDYTNGIGLQVKWALATGSNYQGVADTWNSAQDTGTSNQVNACDSTSNNFFLAQVQLEVSATATPFEHKTFAEELDACERYYEKSYEFHTFIGSTGPAGAWFWRWPSSGPATNTVFFKTEKRITPTMVSYSRHAGTSGKVTNMSGGASDIATNAVNIGTKTAAWNYTSTGSETYCEAQWTSDAEL